MPQIPDPVTPHYAYATTLDQTIAVVDLEEGKQTTYELSSVRDLHPSGARLLILVFGATT